MKCRSGSRGRPAAGPASHRPGWRGTTLLAAGVLAFALAGCTSARHAILPHAHNDYAHAHPLQDALANGFRSVEADVHLVHDTLFVAHDAEDIRPGRTLRALYLDPLVHRIEQGDLAAAADGAPFILLIDLKTRADTTYRAVHKLLKNYACCVTAFAGDTIRRRPLLVVISGNRPREAMRRQPVRYAAYDGRLQDLFAVEAAEFIPLISDNWNKYFTWQGKGPIPAPERRKLELIVRLAHRQGRLLRFWATPDTPSPERENVWRALRRAGVDLINTDDLPGLRRFLRGDGRPVPTAKHPLQN